MNKKKGTLYIVPTPIGNLTDITYRAISVLKKIDIIAAENINHTKILIRNYKIIKNIISVNKHNERTKSKKLIIQLQEGKNIALVSNAGTPTINDPGYYLINYCHQFEIKIVPLPGPCAAITALSASGLSNNKFCYEGFIPSKNIIRKKLLNNLKKETRTIIFYETSNRIISSMRDITQELGADRQIVLAKELTKKWELIQRNTSINILSWLENNKCNIRGEITIITSGFQEKKINILPKTVLNALQILQSKLSLREAIHITAKLYKISKNLLYSHITSKK
ncbi:MAG: 16S rRNA (cytidine(1402)-2'-O)-methyltransferase [Buchnera aphidicola (Melaphis rhois)]